MLSLGTPGKDVVLKGITQDEEDQRLFRGWASVEVVDRDGEVLPMEELEKVMRIWMKRGAPLTDQHTNRVIGRGLNYWRAEKDGKPGVMVEGMVYDDYKTDDAVWEEMKTGKRTGLSFGGASERKERITLDGQKADALVGDEMHELAIVDNPANQEATFEHINMLAKSDKVHDVAKLWEAFQKPFAGYKDFAACVAAHKDKDDPNAYCATIMRNVEGKSEKAGDPNFSTCPHCGKRVFDRDVHEFREHNIPKTLNNVVYSPKKSHTDGSEAEGATIMPGAQDSQVQEKEETMKTEVGKEETQKTEPTAKSPMPEAATKPDVESYSEIKAMLAKILEILQDEDEGESMTASKQGTVGERGLTEAISNAQQVKLPKVPADESTQEGKAPASADTEGEKENILEKAVAKRIAERVKKELGIQTASTPRPEAGISDINKSAKALSEEPALAVLKSHRAEEKPTSWGDIERKRKDSMQEDIENLAQRLPPWS